MKDVVATYRGRPLHNRVIVQHATIAYLNAFADDGACADAHTCAQLRTCGYDRLRMNLRRAHFAASSTLAGISRSTILHINVASAASCPSTVARPSSLQKSPRHEITFISTFN